MNDGTQLHLIFQALYYILKRLDDTEKVVPWKCKGFLAKKLTTPTTPDNSFSPTMNWYANSNFCLVFKGSLLKTKINK